MCRGPYTPKAMLGVLVGQNATQHRGVRDGVEDASVDYSLPEQLWTATFLAMTPSLGLGEGHVWEERGDPFVEVFDHPPFAMEC